ncbi:MAG: 16S rRNA (adenine(1518)-N(6)/adenine(1519)-N(6))-dimethyltransferase RsmA [Thermoanaerobaculia bacterium]
MRPKKRFGQHFLRNRGAVTKIVAAVEPQPGEVIIEIGPGEGVLTEKLLELGPVIAIEIDRDLAPALEQRFGDRIQIRNEDALDAPLPDQPYRAVGNLPYNVGTPILRRVVADPNCKRAVFMLQKEVADRLVAKPGDEAYGYLTLYVQLFATAKTLMTLEPHSFHPPPKVRSAVVVLDPSPKPFASEELIDLISTAFRMRRKTLVNNLTGWRQMSRENVTRAIESAGLNAMVRGENVSLKQFEDIRSNLATPGVATGFSPSTSTLHNE